MDRVLFGAGIARLKWPSGQEGRTLLETINKRVKNLKVRSRKLVRRIFSSENVRTAYEVIRLAAWIWDHRPWL
ncbi:hypothetical protein [Streptomyces mirabilis]|uniref:hypothetical protein n=1 Tax=Streptomyces mirabilis TaxID=68239 RepID=UPI002255DD97|nr:hypothetical protein [Streptomyces mirabilis]MCX4434534.1 hypothetical protein [Streptomyces mirabilis]